MDGWITIGTELDTKQLDKELAIEKRELQQYEKEAERLTNTKAKAELDLSAYEEQKRLIEESTNEIMTQAQSEQEVNRILDVEKKQLDDLNTKYSKEISNLNKTNEKIKENALNQELVKKRVQSITSELQKQQGLTGIQNSIRGIGQSMQNTVKSVARWGLALFGIRSIYTSITRAMSTLSQYNSQMGTNVEYMRYALATALQPVIEKIINLVYKLMSYINYIAQAWFGVNLFANASAKAFQKANETSSGVSKNLGTAKKEAKELNKQLAGFDEMNVLQDNNSTDSGSSGGTGGGIGGATLPSFDLSGLQGEVPSWLKWIADHKNEVIDGILGIVAALSALKNGLGFIKSMGIGIMVFSILKLIQDFIAYLNDPSWSNFGKIIQDIGLFIIGLGMTIGSIPVIVIGAVVLIVGTIIKYWEQIKAFLQKGIDWLTGKSDWVHNMFGDVIGNIYDFFVRTLQRVLNCFDIIFTTAKKVLDGIIQFFKDVFAGNWSAVWEDLKNIVGTIFAGIMRLALNLLTWILDSAKTLVNTTKTLILGFITTIVNWVKNTLITPIANFFKGLWNGIVNGAKTAINNIKNFFNSIPSFFSGIVNKILSFFRNLGASAGNVIAGAFKSVVNGVLRAIENILNSPIRAINGLIGVINKVPGVNLGRLSTFNLPRLAKGTILNAPGKGVPVAGGTAIAGEAGREAYLPLSDTQLLEELGSTIGKYINLNATIPVYVGNRLVLREMKKIEMENNFATNS